MSDQTIARTRPAGARLGVFLGLTLLGLLAIMWLALSIETTTFWTANNIANLLRQTAFIAILAIGQTFVIITGGIDLSVGAVEGFISMMVALLLTNDLGFASTITGAVTISLLIGVGIGLFHAFGVVQMGLPPFIMTLATMYALRGIGLLITNGATISITNDAFTDFSRRRFSAFRGRTGAGSRFRPWCGWSSWWPPRPTSSSITAAGAAICSRSARTRRRPASPASTSRR